MNKIPSCATWAASQVFGTIPSTLSDDLSVLEIELQSKLDNSRIDRGRRNDPKCRRRNIGARVAELRSVERVEELRAKFDVCVLAQTAERCSLDNCYIGVVLAGAKDNAHAAVAETSGDSVASDDRPDSSTRRISHDAALVEVVIELGPAYRAPGRQISIAATRRQLRPIALNPENVICVCAGEGQRQTGLDCRYAGYCPTAEYRVPERIEPFRAWQLIQVAQYKAVDAVEVAEPIVRAVVGLITGNAGCAGSASAPSSGAVSVGKGIGGQELEPIGQPLGQADVQAVIPRRPRRIDVVQARSSEPLDRHTLRDVRYRVCRLAPYWTGCAGQPCLI